MVPSGEQSLRVEQRLVESLQNAEPSHPPPDGGYGWIVVVSCFIINAFTWGVTAVRHPNKLKMWHVRPNSERKSFGVYLSEYTSSSRYPSARPLEFGFIGGLNFSCAMLAAPLVTYMTRMLGLRTVMITGAFLQCLGYVTAAMASRVWHLYLTQGALVGLGISGLVLPSTAVLSQWFSGRRAVANGIASAGSGVGGAAFTWGTAAAVDKMGLVWTLRLTGLAALAATVAATVLLRDRNHEVQPTQLAFDMAIARRPEVILLLLWAFVSMFGYVTLLFSLSDFALAIGLSRRQATNVVGLLNVGTAVGRPVVGLVSDQFSRVGTACVLTFTCGLSCLALWVPAKSFPLLAVFSVLCGAILGIFWMTIGPLAAEVAELKYMQSLLSLAWLTIVIPTACGEVIALRLHELGAPREYLYPQLFACLTYMVASGFLLSLWYILRSKRNIVRNESN